MLDMNFQHGKSGEEKLCFMSFGHRFCKVAPKRKVGAISGKFGHAFDVPWTARVCCWEGVPSVMVVRDGLDDCESEENDFVVSR